MKSFLSISFLTIFLFNLSLVFSNKCNILDSCSDCIQDPECSWCMDPEHHGPHCQITNSETCSDEFIYSPDTRMIKETNSKFNVELRKGLGTSFHSTFKKTDNLPFHVQINSPVHVKVSVEPYCQTEMNCYKGIEFLHLEKTFEVSTKIESLYCPMNPADWNTKVEILSNHGNITIDVKLICDCPCEHNKVENSQICGGFGSLKCGLCECNSEHYGKNCECPITYVNESCRVDDYGLDCSGRGRCICGLCACDKRPNPNERIFGKYCECDNFSCDRYDGELCGGPTRGSCECGHCLCNTGFSGPGCSEVR